MLPTPCSSAPTSTGVPAARDALAAVTALAAALIEAGRLPPRAHRLLDAVWACGPSAAPGQVIAA
jgi:hypothetical protein